MSRAVSAATPRFLDALNYTATVHGKDPLKGTSLPYVAHLLGVCALVLRDGGTEDEAVAALLHDTLEDHPEEVTPAIIEKRFGPEVLAIVQACTDTPPGYKGGTKAPWKERKLAYLQHIRRPDSPGRRVALADKLDNVRSMLADYRDIGERLWSRFNAGKQDQMWFYRSLVGAFYESGMTGFLVDEFERTVSEFKGLVLIDPRDR